MFNIVTGLGETAGDRMVRHPDVDKVAFTGSTEVGKIINRAATDTLKRVTLELGGKSPVIVLPDVDIDATARRRGDRDLRQFGPGLHRRLAPVRAPRHLRQAARRRRRPAPRIGRSARASPPDTMMGPLVSTEQHERVLSYIEQGKKAGASVLCGGDAPGGDGYFVNPTVLVDVKPEMRVVREEIFGPVLAAQRYDDLDEVAKAANDTPYGLAASIWTRDLSAMHKLAAKMQAPAWSGAIATSATDPALAVRRLQAIRLRPRAGPLRRRGLYRAEDRHHRAVTRHSSESWNFFAF